ncbi:iron hydrogenase [Clostridium sp. AF19-22AC]|jgi:iron-only hydrogenase group A|uniref:rubrerythrin n=1 Tax=Clostridia TaxID=186801 RepID=UPI000E4D8891|nr:MULTISPECIES: [FeFe] hydrogenase, group A [Clostridia]RHR32445.1 iron hydrogenase [Clostridium sp. AF19-22AC]
MHQFTEIRIPIEKDNPSIKRNEDLCIKCGQCRRVCEEEIGVGKLYSLKSTSDKAICIHCGQCANVCPVGSITEVYEYQKVKEAIRDPEKVVIFSTSPSVRVGLGEEFGMPYGSFVEGEMVAALRRLGADYVLDTNFAADLTIMEEASELVRRVTENDKPLPQFTSCCPGWVKFVETFYPEILPHISSAKSPIGMQGPTVKTYFAKSRAIDPEKIVNVAVTPCTAKKFEIRRDEMNDSAYLLDIANLRDMDHVITTRELARWMREEGIELKDVGVSGYDELMGEASGAGVIFGNTGGVMEAAARTAHFLITGENPPDDYLKLNPVRGMDGIREADVKIGDTSLKLAVIHGTENARKFLDKWKEDQPHYDFVEVMACRGGCIGGGGQPKTEIPMTDEIRKARIASLYTKDSGMQLRYSHENQEIKKLYDEFYEAPLSGLAEQMLHTSYRDRSKDLGPEGKLHINEAGENSETNRNINIEEKENETMKKWKCTVCGYIHEGENPPEQCPICKVPADRFAEVIEDVTADVSEEAVQADTAVKRPEEAPAKGTKTEKNLMEAFAGESMARSKYTYWSGVAKENGLEQMAAIFMETAEQEREHAKMWFSLFHGINGVEQNLIDAAAGENEEWTQMYRRMAEEAREEGYDAIAAKFELVAKVEAQHEKRYLRLLENYRAGKTFKGEAPLGWKCRNCGYIHEGPEAPETCPVCMYTKAYFERQVHNY